MTDNLFINSSSDERKGIILNQTVTMIEAIEDEGKEICGYVTFIFYPDGGVGTAMQNEGILNPAHILEALEVQGIIPKVST